MGTKKNEKSNLLRARRALCCSFIGLGWYKPQRGRSAKTDCHYPLFFTLMQKRHKKKPTLIPSNLSFNEWGSFLANCHSGRTSPTTPDAIASGPEGRVPSRGVRDWESQRDSIPKPRVARNELPWVRIDEDHDPTGVAPRSRMYRSSHFDLMLS